MLNHDIITNMKWYKKQLKQLLENQTKAAGKTPAKILSPKKSLPTKVIHHGLEKRSRPKTDSK